MKPKIDIICGFPGDGKTNFINYMLKNDEQLNDHTLIILTPNHLDAQDLSLQIQKCRHDRIIIAYNSMSGLIDLINILNSCEMRQICSLNKVFHVIDALTFEQLINNEKASLTKQISLSDLIIVNNAAALTPAQLDNIAITLWTMNGSAQFFKSVNREDHHLEPSYEVWKVDKLGRKTAHLDRMTVVFLILAAMYFLISIIQAVDAAVWTIAWARLQVLSTVFLSILIQAIPFILFGVFISSAIQVFISSETLSKIFPRNTILGFMAALVAGLFFPVCDCAIIPVASRFIKKGVPVPVAVTFMLAAPIVNPIVIASTLYAFPGQPLIAVYRVLLGITIALAVGIVLIFFPEENSILLQHHVHDMDYEVHSHHHSDSVSCSCSCGDTCNETVGFEAKAIAIFRHASEEFFEVGRYLIIGAFLCSIVQTFVPPNVFTNHGGEYGVSVLIMMLLAFVLSICSTSDAFIARTFVNQFPMGAVMGFMVLGPMIDIKNLLMLLGSFKKSFIVKLVSLIFVLAFVFIMMLTKNMF